jgi:hypothetical protein
MTRHLSGVGNDCLHDFASIKMPLRPICAMLATKRRNIAERPKQRFDPESFLSSRTDSLVSRLSLPRVTRVFMAHGQVRTLVASSHLTTALRLFRCRNARSRRSAQGRLNRGKIVQAVFC